MIEKYFSGNRENEVELCAEIKLCLADFILKQPKDIFYLIEFHEFELTPKRVFNFTDFEEYSNFVDNRDSNHPRLLIEKSEKLFFEFNGKEIHANFELVNQEIKINIFYVMRLEYSS